eukprot:Opistho-2@8142
MRSAESRQSGAGPASPTAPAHPDAEADRLFCKHTISEIRVIEKRIRGDIERKKEELRQMVGERYRDLIGAADSIMTMKTASDQIQDGIEKIDTLCRQAGRFRDSDAATDGSKKADVAVPASMHASARPRAAFYSAATQMKLLVDTPEQIWGALERREHLRAAQLYLIAEYMFANISIDEVSAVGVGHVPLESAQQRGSLLASFPILNRQWAAIGHFRDPILQGARGDLAAETIDEASLADAACTVVLLDDRTPKEVLAEYLAARTALIRSLFRPEGFAATTAKEQICRVVRVVKTTLSTAHNVFFSRGSAASEANAAAAVFPSGKLAAALRHVTAGEDAADVPYIARLFTGGSMHAIVRNLPHNVQKFRPTSHLHTTSIRSDPAKTRAECQLLASEWLVSASSIVSEGATGALAGVQTVKSLRSLADAVWDTLNDGKDSSEDWSELCIGLVGRVVPLWDLLLRHHVVARAKEMLEVAFSRLSRVPGEMIAGSASSPVHEDVGAWVWSDEGDQMQIDQNSGGAVGGGGYAFASGSVGGLVAAVDLANPLALKSIGVTPFVRDVCAKFDSSLAGILDDARHAFGSPDDDRGHVSASIPADEPLRGGAHGPFDRRDDGGD